MHRDYDGAEEYYLKAIGANPKHADSLGNYAVLLHGVKQQYDKAEDYYKKAIDAEPDHTNNLGNYALFLAEVRSAHKEAEALYIRAIQVLNNCRFRVEQSTRLVVFLLHALFITMIAAHV